MKYKATGNIRHTGIVVKDLELMTCFYVENFGFKSSQIQNESGDFVSTILGHKNIRVTTHKLVDEKNQCLELLFFPDMLQQKTNNNKRKLFDMGITHIALTVSDLETIHQKLTDLNISFVSSIQYAPSNKVKVIFCEDPEGNFLELVEELQEANCG
ncbi:MAG: glyoxalase/bleomycin resistance protein/dioxygenase [Candidatus Magnetoglobus multicellularis str. Araruama]|uniref:Glyoxalase/bleomycin resistance protein/dioxygenase n=1 Tax=Candidatus Magnetoglobus multicellularis str. Araruama TaxID=890399 RepID=A0A1V1NS56_9BACT|nr:MAG: glyoxalase/bleomycin resistance protein/dioxygenase [Candidatus Magnetoglobus multicellularis str. Araruama]